MIKPLTSLRFVFALMVFLSHMPFASLPPGSLIRTLYDAVFYEGFLGVSFFFILSGFILAYNYEHKILAGRITKRDFWVARFARIYPLHIVTMLVAIPVYLFELKGESMRLDALLANVSLTQSFSPNPYIFFSFNSVSWSISDEAFFYLSFPFLIWGFVKLNRNLTILIACIAVTVLICLLPQHQVHWWVYISPLTRIVDFTLGIGLFTLYEKWNNRISVRAANYLEILSLVTFAAFFLVHTHISIKFRYSCYYWPSMVLIIFSFSLQKGLVSRLISGRWCILLGEISFAFYMVHASVLRYYRWMDPGYQARNPYLLVIVLLGITIGLSYIAHAYIEMPLNRWIKEKLSGKRTTVKKDLHDNPAQNQVLIEVDSVSLKR